MSRPILSTFVPLFKPYLNLLTNPALFSANRINPMETFTNTKTHRELKEIMLCIRLPNERIATKLASNITKGLEIFSNRHKDDLRLQKFKGLQGIVTRMIWSTQEKLNSSHLQSVKCSLKNCFKLNYPLSLTATTLPATNNFPSLESLSNCWHQNAIELFDVIITLRHRKCIIWGR